MVDIQKKILSKDQNLCLCWGTDFHGKHYSLAELKKMEERYRKYSPPFHPHPSKSWKGLRREGVHVFMEWILGSPGRWLPLERPVFMEWIDQSLRIQMWFFLFLEVHCLSFLEQESIERKVISKYRKVIRYLWETITASLESNFHTFVC